jgi:hypothetical protein
VKLIHVGFFRELPYGDKEGSLLKDSVSSFSGADVERVVTYLKSGVVFIVAPGVSMDHFSNGQEVIGPLTLLTDGKFLWPSDLAFYLQRYKIAIPSDLLRHMETNGWKIPSVDISILEM